MICRGPVVPKPSRGMYTYMSRPNDVRLREISQSKKQKMGGWRLGKLEAFAAGGGGKTPSNNNNNNNNGTATKRQYD